MSDAQCSSGGGCGCISIILTLMFLWALVFGVTWNGRHHDIECTSERGVELKSK